MGPTVKLRYLYAIFMPMVMTEVFGLYLDYTESTEFIHQRAGYDIRLHCGVEGLMDEEQLADKKIYWFFKCREKTFISESCHKWMQLPCEENFCQSDLLLHNVTEEYSGLYKCTVVPLKYKSGHALDIQFVRTYQLDVKNTSAAIPKFVDPYPLNKTAVINDQVVFQCRVQSEEHPTIKWFRRTPASLPNDLENMAVNSNNLNAHIVHYNGHIYELLHTAGEKYIGEDMFLSKLILNGVSLRDAGYYACAAITFHGYKIREAFLEVHRQGYVEDYSANGEAYTDPSEFWLLFLMPVGLAMPPLIFWLSYLIYKRYTTHTEIQRNSQTYSEDFIEDDNCVLRA
ncbi:fibroblast growth factor receptor-like 1 [Bactrocera neohumeralis]|uniref:fibroblast growth factor receptor-like 1 n=1 Tax=Bactrocera neohumeralis TaxID=98809 RepID=UPI00216681D6|nr:fibroblast growth factor receptor-like 1 [Bactrocera neohumeralis]XP_050333465.1 fibroblast growth factor receptor-like 1 [Bactrocera neohumeralis]XP_050333473.1 fibroblast growth factor receptor-like 1 [Bactrocera neohumeralis]XP_050333482.1 fibroblast growth factor receptor-like 1 [Bactrocera neohumeralis]